VDGAWDSGERAAAAALKKIGPPKPPAPEKPSRSRKKKRQPHPASHNAGRIR
jgi:hypothetical protein